MACPFCALGCKDGPPTQSEVNRLWRLHQLSVHPDLAGGNNEASVYLNQTKEFAMMCFSSGAVSRCPKHPLVTAKATSSWEGAVAPQPQSAPPVVEQHSPGAPLPEGLPQCPPSWGLPLPQQAPQSHASPHVGQPAFSPQPQQQQQVQASPQQQQQAQASPQREQPAHPWGAMPWGWYWQRFKCVWCSAEMYIEGHGSWPFVKAQENGWRKSPKKSWETSATCRSCHATTASEHPAFSIR